MTDIRIRRDDIKGATISRNQERADECIHEDCDHDKCDDEECSCHDNWQDD